MRHEAVHAVEPEFTIPVMFAALVAGPGLDFRDISGKVNVESVGGLHGRQAVRQARLLISPSSITLIIIEVANNQTTTHRPAYAAYAVDVIPTEPAADSPLAGDTLRVGLVAAQGRFLAALALVTNRASVSDSPCRGIVFER